MSWRTETRVNDLADETEIEVSCKTCGKHRYVWARELKNEARLGQLYFDELARAMICFDRTCKGSVKLCIMHDHLEEGFVGGMP